MELIRLDDKTKVARESGGVSYTIEGLINKSFNIAGTQTCFGMITDGRVAITLNTSNSRFELSRGMFFCVSNADICAQESSRSLLILQNNCSFPNVCGGPIEPVGRLKYIDGCSDSVLISPPRMGDSCLNFLHIPANTNQTMHYHPTDRVGIILHGAGRCVTRKSDIEISAGDAWLIPNDTWHCFRTQSNSLDVLTWHPDSDFGPTDDNHPMINRTWLNETDN
jgi:mannose-6-phosphate isomerase-like protein (cupin superfamily)